MPVRPDAGFTYLTVLFVIVFMGIGWSLAGEVWHTSQRRDREAELLFVGNQYRRAIELYYQHSGGGVSRYPRELADLLKDSRQPVTRRYLRKLYFDPITGKSEWGLIRSPDGGIMGVHSLSEDRPIKIAGFRSRDLGFDGRDKYSEWRFLYSPPSGAIAAPRATQPSATK